MSDILPIFVHLLFLTACIALIGEPLRMLLSRFSSFFGKLDVLQMITLDVYLGALALYVIALVPLQLFTSTTVVGVTLVSFGFVILYYAQDIAYLREKFRNLNFSRLCILITVFLMFLTVLWLEIAPRTSFIFGSIHDEALHSLFAEIVIENKGIPEMQEPYLSQPLVYTQGHTVVNVYACYLLGYVPPKAVQYSTALFIAFTVLGAYFLGSFLNGKVLGVSFAFILAFASFWPKRITWGANAEIYGFAPYLICLGFLPSLLDSKRIRSRDIIVVGFLFGYLAVSYLPFYQALMSSFTVLLFVNILRKRRDITSKLKAFFVIFISGVPLFIVSVYRFVKWYPSLKAPLRKASPLLWFEIFRHFSPLEDNWLSWYPFITTELLALIAVSAVAISLWRKNRSTVVKGSVKVISSNLIGMSFFLALASLIPPASRIINDEAFMMSGILALLLLVGTFNALLYLHLTSGFREIFLPLFSFHNYIGVRFLQLLRKNAKKTLILLFLLLTLTPLVLHRIIYDPDNVIKSSAFSVTTRNDYDLMVWMRDHLPKNATILINPYDAGNYIPSVSHRKVIYLYQSLRRHDPSYQRLLTLIFGGNLNSTALELMKELDVSHVFVGSRVTYWWDGYIQWDPILFFSHPNFRLEKSFGRSYLFAVSY